MSESSALRLCSPVSADRNTLPLRPAFPCAGGLARCQAATCDRPANRGRGCRVSEASREHRCPFRSSTISFGDVRTGTATDGNGPTTPCSAQKNLRSRLDVTEQAGIVHHAILVHLLADQICNRDCAAA